MQFEFSTVNRIIFGVGMARQLGGIAASMGNRVLLVTNLPEVRIASVQDDLTRHGIDVNTYVVTGEPTVAIVSEGVNITRQHNCDLIIGIGGGSAIDAAKAIAALSTNPGDIVDYLEVIGKGVPITNAPLPLIAAPTTAGTGAEVTLNAVIGSPEHGMKVSLRSPFLLPKLALVDPEMTFGLPPEITASTGLDALTQLIEPYVSVRSNPLTDVICREGMVRVARSLRGAYENNDLLAREEMSLASLFGGLALANSGLGVVHGFASVLGGMYPAPHGVICARLLPAVMAVNLRALQVRMPDNPTIQRYTEIAQILTGKANANAADGIAWVKELCAILQVSPLSEFGISTTDYIQIVEKAAKASSTKANPIQLSLEELHEVLGCTP